MQWLRPQLRLWWWSAYCPPPSLQFQKITITSQSHSVCFCWTQRERKCHKNIVSHWTILHCFKIGFVTSLCFTELELGPFKALLHLSPYYYCPNFHFTKDSSYMCMQKRIKLNLWDNSHSSTTMRLKDALWFLRFSLGLRPKQMYSPPSSKVIFHSRMETLFRTFFPTNCTRSRNMETSGTASSDCITDSHTWKQQETVKNPKKVGA